MKFNLKKVQSNFVLLNNFKFNKKTFFKNQSFINLKKKELILKRLLIYKKKKNINGINSNTKKITSKSLLDYKKKKNINIKKKASKFLLNCKKKKNIINKKVFSKRLLGYKKKKKTKFRVSVLKLLKYKNVNFYSRVRRINLQKKKSLNSLFTIRNFLVKKKKNQIKKGYLVLLLILHIKNLLNLV